jgi:hypothetical protein
VTPRLAAAHLVARQVGRNLEEHRTRLALAAPQVADPEQSDAALLDYVLGIFGGHEHASDVLEQRCPVQADQLDQPVPLSAVDRRRR